MTGAENRPAANAAFHGAYSRHAAATPSLKNLRGESPFSARGDRFSRWLRVLSCRFRGLRGNPTVPVSNCLLGSPTHRHIEEV